MKNSYENLGDVKRMQDEAIKRAQQMQKKARKSLELSHFEPLPPNDNLSFGKNTRAENQEVKKENIFAPGLRNEPISTPKNSVPNKQNGILNLLTKDSEKSLILVLLLLLIDEGCDMSLILALMYLII